MKTLALIIAHFLPHRVKYYAMMDYLDPFPSGKIVIDDSKYVIEIEKTLRSRKS